jgi:predicted transcriptional regulator
LQPQYERITFLAVPRSTTSIRLPDDLIQALDERAAALGVTRSQLIIEAVERALEDRSAWSPAFLKAIGTSRPELEEAVDEMMEAIQNHRSRSEAPEL